MVSAVKLAGFQQGLSPGNSHPLWSEKPCAGHFLRLNTACVYPGGSAETEMMEAETC